MFGIILKWLTGHWRMALYGVAVAVIVGAATLVAGRVRSWHSAYTERPELIRQRDAAVATVKRTGEETARNARIANDLHDQIDRLRADLRQRPITVRVCPQPARPVLPARTAARTDAPAPGPVAGAVEADSQSIDVTGPLNDYALDCAATGLQLVALQRWVRERP